MGRQNSITIITDVSTEYSRVMPVHQTIPTMCMQVTEYIDKIYVLSCSSSGRIIVIAFAFVTIINLMNFG